MKKLYASFIFRGERLTGYIDGYTPYMEDDYALIYVPEKRKIYSIKINDLDVEGYRDV